MWRSKQTHTDEMSRSTVAGLAPQITPKIPADALRSTSETMKTTAALAPDLDVTGKISGNEDLCINGTVEEPISLKCCRLTVGSRAKVTAEVVAREVVVYGEFHGNLRARDRIEIKKDGAVVGDVITARVLIEEGAYLKGKVEIERRKAPRGLPPKRI
jgi:cytoskeletal protein CcmA (bactofilin family)